MDIAKYIGLFLLKNHFCYVHGLGNLELHKKSAMHDGKSLQGPSYDVVVTPGGSIDDNLANFIAVNEQISISKAANALREYSIQARKDLAAGKDVPLPNIGRFVEVSGKVQFITDDNFRFTPAGIPTIRNSKQLEEQNAKPLHKPSFPEPTKADSINWSMVIIVVVLLIIIGGGAYGIYYYMSHNKPSSAALSAPSNDTVVKVQAKPAPDTSHAPKDTLIMAAQAAPAVDTNQINIYKMIIGSYSRKEQADTRVRNLKKNGTQAELFERDSANYFVYTIINCRVVDTVHIKDSLRTLFGFKNVMILN